jgi:hypothetical protein
MQSTKFRWTERLLAATLARRCPRATPPSPSSSPRATERVPVVIHAGLQHFPPLLFSALRFTFVALPAVFFVSRPRVRWY